MDLWIVEFDTPFGAAAAAGAGGRILRVALPSFRGASAMSLLAGSFPAKGARPPAPGGFRKRLEVFSFHGGPPPEVDLSGLNPFDREVLEAMMRVPRGSVASYGELAAAIGRPRAARAVGAAAGRNRVPLIAPCHRIVGADGRLTGFSSRGGLPLKRRMLEFEGVRFAQGAGARVERRFFCCLTLRAKCL